jgi:ribosomal protein S18 acetylase RimI-like enzyme
MEPVSDILFQIRTYRPSDLPACKRLFADGLIGGRLAENDCGPDIAEIEKAYLNAGGHFWVAELTDPAHTGEVVGMVGVQQREKGSVEIRRLRVDERFRRRGIGSGLMDQALRHCQDHGHLRIILDTFMEREPAVRLFQKFRFRHVRTRRTGEKDKLYFYLDLYTENEGRGNSQGAAGG